MNVSSEFDPNGQSLSSEERRRMAEVLSANDSAGFHALLAAGYPTSALYYSMTLLHRAADNGFAEGCRVLLDAGLDVGSTSSNAMTPLHYAAKRGSAEVCGILIDAGADVSARDHFEKTPLHHAVAFGSVEATRLMLAAGADPNAEDSNGWIPLRFTEKGDVASALLKAGCDPHKRSDAQSTMTYTPFQIFVSTNKFEVVQACLEHTVVDLGQRTSDSRTLMQIASRHVEVKQLLRSTKTVQAVREISAPPSEGVDQEPQKRGTGLGPL